MPSRRVYLDFDDVLSETAKDLAALLERSFGTRVAYEDIRSFDLGKSFKLSPDELDRFLAAAHAPVVLENIPPVAGAAKTLAGWMDAGLEVCIVTGRPPDTETASRKWLKTNQVPYSELLFVDKYGRHGEMPGSVTLAEVARMDFLFAVDDAPGMLNFLIHKMTLPVLIYDRPWNRETLDLIPPGRKVVRCKSYEEIRREAGKLT